MARLSEPSRRMSISDADAERAFHDALAAAGIPEGREWAERYVDYEWDRSRHFVAALLGDDLGGRRALEVGCYVGGTAIVLAALGAAVVGIDAEERWLRPAALNARRYGLAHRLELAHVPDLGSLPFAPESFDLMTCNSVLEYLDDRVRTRLFRELDRALVPGGVLIVLGTSNRIWPRENHTARWFVNYLPQRVAFPRRPGAWCGRALWPWQLTQAFAGYRDLLGEGGGAVLLSAKERMRVARWKLPLLRLAATGARVVGVPLGALGPTISMALRKPG